MKIEVLYEKLAAPAQRALQTLRLAAVEDLSKYTRERISELHGIGPSALRVIEQEMTSLNITFLDTDEGVAGVERLGISSVDQYIKRSPQQAQVKLDEMRRIIQAAAPDASEKISYQIPTYYLFGNLVHFAGYEKHIGFYPGANGISTFKEELKVFKNAKGSVQFPLEDPLPEELIKRIVKFRVEENTKGP